MSIGNCRHCSHRESANLPIVSIEDGVSSGEDATNAGSEASLAADFVAVSQDQIKAAELLKAVLQLYGDLQKLPTHPGSPMEIDDRYLAEHGSSMQALAIHRLLSVMDHLQLASFTLAKFPAPLIFSQFTLIRSALSGAATSLWIIDPLQAEKRRIRAMKLACYDLDQYKTFATAALNDSVGMVSRGNLEGNVEKLAANRRMLYESICDNERALGKTKMPEFDGIGKINEVAIVQAAGRKLESLGRLPSGVQVELQYRVLSGIAHNCLWASMTGATAASRETARDGLYVTTTESIQGNFDNVYNGAITALEITKLAASRFRDLASAVSESDQDR